MRQKPGETLRKYIQRFSQTRNKIPNATDAQVISAFQAGVTDVRMLEKFGTHDNITSTVVKLFDLADKCAKAEEGRLFIRSKPVDPEEGSRKRKSSEKLQAPRGQRQALDR